MSDQTSVDIPASFPMDHPNFPGFPTNLKDWKELQKAGGDPMKIGLYRVAVLQLQQDAANAARAQALAETEASKTPEQRQKEALLKKAAIGVAGAAVLGLVTTGVAAKMGAFHANPSVWKNHTVREVLQELAVLDDGDTDLGTTLDAEGTNLIVFEDVGPGSTSGGVPTLVVHIKQVGNDVHVEMHTPAQGDNNGIQDALKAAAKSNIFAGKDLNNVAADVMQQAQGSLQSLVSGAGSLIDPKNIANMGKTALTWDKIWDILDKAFGMPENPDMISKGLDFLQSFIK